MSWRPTLATENTPAAATVDPLDALEEKWRTEPADRDEWAMRAMRTLALARKWRQSAEEWEALARKETTST